MSSPGDFNQRRKNWTGGEMDASAVDEEFRSIRRSLGNNIIPLQNIVTSLSLTVDSILVSPFVTIGNVAALSSERALTGTSAQITVTDNGANSTAVLSIPDPFNSPGVVNVPNTKLKVGSIQTLPIVQVVTASVSSSSTTTSGTFTDSGLTLSITPKFSTSKFFIFACGMANVGGGASGYLNLARGGTNLGSGSGFVAVINGTVANVSMFSYDSPATASAITYSVQFKTDGGATIAFPTNTFGTVPQANLMAVELAQ